MKRKFLTGVLSVLLYFTVALSMISVTYAWLCYGKGVDLNVKGTAIANYFHSGTGTENDPYILTTPRHVYNLAWLQYLGTFNDITGGKLNSQVYFELGGNINMADGADTGYQTIPPIGTSEYPFLGNFDGKGFNISNAIVANKIGSDGLVAHPPVIDDVRYSEIIGFFGIVGDYTGAVELTSTQLKALEVKNLTLTDVTIKTSTTKSLAGLFAGYVNGNVSNINVVSGDIVVNKNVLPYTEALTETHTINDTLSMSKYALIGDYHTTRINWVGGPGSVSTDSGDDAGWGGSIDILTLAKRITYLYGAATATSNTNYWLLNTTVSNNNNSVVATAKTGSTENLFDFNASKSQTVYFKDGTYMPLNIEMDDETFGQSQYNSGSKEAAKAGNTGFIVGSGSTTTRFNTNDFSIKTRLVGQLCNSMQGGSPEKYAWKTLTYTDTINSQLQILTKDINGNYYVIGDNVNKLTSESTPFSVYSNVGITVKTLQQLGLTQYDGSTANQVRTKLARMLKSNKNLNGLCFPLYSSPSETNLLTFGGNTISMGGKDVNSLVKNSIHFVVEKAGVITMVAATVSSKYDELPGESYNTATAAYVLPMLYQVKRYANGDIEKLIPVKYICRDNTTNDIEILSALTSSGTAPEGKTLLFNYDTMSRLTTGDNSNADKAYMDSLFYFEIPIGAGEYVLGSSGSSSAYLLYLDIGANAGKDLEETPDGGDGTGGTGTPEDSDEKGTIEGVAFAYKSGDLYVQIIKIVKDGNGKDVAIVVTFDFSLKDKSSNAHTGATAKFTGTAPTGSNAASVTTSNNNTGQFTITENDTGSG